MLERSVAQACQQIPAFHHLNESECRQIMEIAREKLFQPGDKVIEQGGQSQNLWILMSGKCEVIKNGSPQEPVVLAELEPYNFFGEMSFFSPAPHSASVVAQTPVRLLSIARQDYDDFICDGVDAAYKLAYNVVESLAGRLRQMDERFAELSAHTDEVAAKEAHPDWRVFREKLFNGWNL